MWLDKSKPTLYYFTEQQDTFFSLGFDHSYGFFPNGFHFRPHDSVFKPVQNQ